MPGRKKRLKKGIETLKKRVFEHNKKSERFLVDGKIEAAEFAKEEAQEYQRQIEKKIEQLKKQTK